jgi:hypothetical protein
MTLSRHTPLVARTPLRTHTGLQASGSWSRSVPLLSGKTKSAATARSGPVPPVTATRRETGFSRKVKLQVRTRAGNGEPENALCELPDYLTAYARARIEIQPDGCWYWTGSVNPKGYGVANLPGGKRAGAHQHVFGLSGGVVAAGMTLDHQCHNRDRSCPGGKTCLHRRCVNPAHLEEATRGDNSRRGKGTPALNLAKEKCPEGHDYDYVDPRGWRQCTRCGYAKEVARRRAAGVSERKTWQPACSKGHEYTPENTYWSKGKRYCKACDREKLAARRAKTRKPCRGCGGPVGGGSPYRYCEQCRADRRTSGTVNANGKVVTRRSPRSTGFSRAVKLLVRTRAGNGCADEARCEACGLWLGRRHGECQHLVARGMGGTSNPLLSTPANAALLCRDCHRTAESRDRETGARGFWLPQGTDPRMVPMMLASEHGSGVLVWRSEDGRYLTEAPEVRAA